jgi:hypothetical protein
MLNHPSNYQFLLGRDHSYQVQFTLLQFGKPVGKMIPPPSIGGDANDATIQMDTTANVMRTCSFTLSDPTDTLEPGNSGYLIPAGNEIAVQYRTDDGLGNWQPWFNIGVFGITETDQNDSVDATGGSAYPGPYLNISGSDRSFIVGASTLTAPYQTASGVGLASITQTLIQQQVPWLPNSVFAGLNDGGFILPRQILNIGDNIWNDIQSWWNDQGLIIYWDGNGNLQGRPFNSSIAPVSSYFYGDGLTASVATPWTAQNSYNGVTVTGNDVNNNPIYATAWDTNQNSPTYYSGPFGERPAPPVSSSTVTTTAQCLAAAQLLLPQYLGISHPTTTTLIPDPTLEAYDITTLNFPTQGIGYTAWILQAYTFPLDLQYSMSCLWVPALAAV